MTELAAGVTVGHWSDPVAVTGCTVVRFPEGTVASGEVRGGAPATREFALLAPGRLVDRLDALVLSGGSAFGLAAADGVARALADDGVGHPTADGVVPIVVGLSLYDLGVGSAEVHPTSNDGAIALRAAEAEVKYGRVGAGIGATVGKWRGRDHAAPGGIGVARIDRDGLSVAVILAVNAWGAIDDGEVPAAIEAGSFDGWPTFDVPAFENTTIGAIVTNARLTKTDCHLVAQAGHDGFARALFPAHARGDGDALVAAATGTIGAEAHRSVDEVRLLATVAVEAAVRRIG